VFCFSSSLYRLLSAENVSFHKTHMYGCKLRSLSSRQVNNICVAERENTRQTASLPAWTQRVRSLEVKVHHKRKMPSKKFASGVGNSCGDRLRITKNSEETKSKLIKNRLASNTDTNKQRYTQVNCAVRMYPSPCRFNQNFSAVCKHSSDQSPLARRRGVRQRAD
jgi:hypothetical protein